MIQHIGNEGNLAFFSNGTLGVSINVDLNIVVALDHLTSFTSQVWAEGEAPEEVHLLASAALNTPQTSLAASSSRMYTIPGGVQAEAKKALKWRHEAKRGGTPVGLNTARTLAKGGQIGIEKIRHIAKYFPRHEVDKRGKGWEPGEEHFPSNGRIAWALWGGDAGWRWAQTVVDRENAKALTAGAYDFIKDGSDLPKYDAEVNAFKEAHELDQNVGPEFLARVRMDGSGIDRLYKIEIDGSVYVWDDCGWDNLGNVDGDIYTYDAALDDVYDTCEKTHLIIDPSSAIIISALMQENPHKCVTLEDIDAEEAAIMVGLMETEDWDLINYAMTAAGDNSTNPTIGNDGDGVDTPEERAARAEKQARNALGRFAKVGQRIAVGGDSEKGAGTIVSIDAKNGLTDVKMDDGRVVTVGIKYTQPLESVKTRGNAVRVDNNENMPLDVSGILGEPRTPINQPKAHLPGTLPPLTDDEIHTMLTDWGKYVENQRSSYKPTDAADKARVKKTWGVTKFAGDNSIVAAGEQPDKEEQLTPKTSDVAPKYLALVSPDDPQAVMDMVAIVPETKQTTTPVVYRRKDGEWVRDDQVLMDLKSATPPDVVKLDGKELVNDILKQVDGLVHVTASAYEHLLNFWYGPVTAAGGLDRNRGNAEQLRHYWTRGEGAAKIRWGTPGDWKRCVRYLSKHLGTRAKGYCQLRHKDALGYYTATHAKRDRNNG
jgi:hypothetical protein